MGRILIDFQDGFHDDMVIVCLNGKEIFKKQQLRTQALTGLADTFAVETDSGQAELEVILPKRDISKNIPIEIIDELHIGISIEGDEIRHIVSSSPFGYA